MGAGKDRGWDEQQNGGGGRRRTEKGQGWGAGRKGGADGAGRAGRVLSQRYELNTW